MARLKFGAVIEDESLAEFVRNQSDKANSRARSSLASYVHPGNMAPGILRPFWPNLMPPSMLGSHKGRVVGWVAKRIKAWGSERVIEARISG